MRYHLHILPLGLQICILDISCVTITVVLGAVLLNAKGAFDQ